MKKLFLGMAGVFLLLAINGSAEAYTIYPDSIHESYMTSKDSPDSDDTYSWAVTITDIANLIDDLGVDSSSTVNLDVYLADDEDAGTDFEGITETARIIAKLLYNGTAVSISDYTTLFTTSVELTDESTTGESSIDITSLFTYLFSKADSDDLSDYTLQLTVQAEYGDFNLTKVELTPNPEPATFMLMGLGLLGFARATRRKLS